MKFRILVWLLLVALMACGLFAAETLLEQRQLASKTLRLHVVTNSDSEEDQAQKLRVRDAVLDCVGALTADCKDAAAAQEKIKSHLEEITQAAQRVLHAEGADYGVEASVGMENFATRKYDTFTLPAGEYPALRIKIGNAAGHNWWCVVFPTLCVPASSEGFQETAEASGLSSQLAGTLTREEGEYEIRFQFLDWLGQVKNWLHS